MLKANLTPVVRILLPGDRASFEPVGQHQRSGADQLPPIRRATVLLDALRMRVSNMDWIFAADQEPAGFSPTIQKSTFLFGTFQFPVDRF